MDCRIVERLQGTGCVDKQQYRMQESLASLAERFANSEQTLDDALALANQVLSEGSEE
jgi:hypothetical protein